MIDFSTLFQKYRAKFIDEVLSKKTTWGRNEMVKEFDNWYIGMAGEMTSAMVETIKETK